MKPPELFVILLLILAAAGITLTSYRRAPKPPEPTAENHVYLVVFMVGNGGALGYFNREVNTPKPMDSSALADMQPKLLKSAIEAGPQYADAGPIVILNIIPLSQP